MKTLTVGHLKTTFSDVLTHVRQGAEYGIAYGKQKKTVAVIVPIEKYQQQHKKKMGVLESKGKIIITKQFKMTDQEFLRA